MTLLHSFLIIVFFQITGCMTMQPHGHIDPEFQEYADLFQTTCAPMGNVSIVFRELGEKYAGICHRSTSGYGVVEIDIVRWHFMGWYGRHELVFHELGHCSLGQKHREFKLEVDGKKYPGSIMYPTVFGDIPEYKENISYYVQELCG